MRRDLVAASNAQRLTASITQRFTASNVQIFSPIFKCAQCRYDKTSPCDMDLIFYTGFQAILLCFTYCYQNMVNAAPADCRSLILLSFILTNCSNFFNLWKFMSICAIANNNYSSLISDQCGIISIPIDGSIYVYGLLKN